MGGADGVLTPTRNKPSFTPEAAEGETRVRPILVRPCIPVEPAHVRVME